MPRGLTVGRALPLPSDRTSPLIFPRRCNVPLAHMPRARNSCRLLGGPPSLRHPHLPTPSHPPPTPTSPHFSFPPVVPPPPPPYLPPTPPFLFHPYPTPLLSPTPPSPPIPSPLSPQLPSPPYSPPSSCLLSPSTWPSPTHSLACSRFLSYTSKNISCTLRSFLCRTGPWRTCLVTGLFVRIIIPFTMHRNGTFPFVFRRLNCSYFRITLPLPCLLVVDFC